MGQFPDINSIKDENDALDQSVALNKIVVQLLDDKKRENKRSWIAFIIACVVFVLGFIGIIYDNMVTRNNLLNDMADMRNEFTQALADERNAWIEYVSSLEIVDTVTETTTQTIEGDNSNLVNGNQYNDSATHNDGKGVTE